MSTPYLLSVLDQSPIAAGSTTAQAIANTIDLARTADRLGYHRYWMAEHHASPALGGAAPEAMIGPVALATERIRVGSGGIMLPHYSPFKVAEMFRMLTAIAPGRIDLGLGRAPGSDQRTALALRQDRARGFGAEDFTASLAELLAYLDEREGEGTGLPADHVFASLRDTLPSGGGSLPVWLLGSSPDSAMLAGRLGLPYCVADFINPDAVDLGQLYRDSFRPSERAAQPHLIVAAWAIAADSHAEAERLGAPAAMIFAHLMRGRQIAVPSVADAVEWVAANPGEVRLRKRRVTLGTAAEVHQGLDHIARLYGAEEMMLLNILPDHATRRHSYELIAAEYGLAMLDRAA